MGLSDWIELHVALHTNVCSPLSTAGLDQNGHDGRHAAPPIPQQFFDISHDPSANAHALTRPVNKRSIRFLAKSQIEKDTCLYTHRSANSLVQTSQICGATACSLCSRVHCNLASYKHLMSFLQEQEQAKEDILLF
jgi:hypothetical protein